jgi:hypothetical protein
LMYFPTAIANKVTNRIATKIANIFFIDG